jgi:class 3 adenylate cyclase
MPEVEQEIRFCTTPEGVRIAYAVLGEGTPLVYVPGWISHLELDWQLPLTREGWQAYAPHFRVIRIDKRGTGLSDRNVGDYSLESRVRDLEALVEHLGLGEFMLSGISEGGPTCISYAAKHPERVTRMALYGTFAKGDLLGGGSPDLRNAILAVVRAEWGMGSRLLADMFVGEDADPVVLQMFTEYQRQGATPEDAYAMLEADMEIDVRELLPKVQAPTLIVHARGDKTVPIDLGRELAAGIPNARFESVDGSHVMGIEPSQPLRLAFLRHGLEAAADVAGPAPSGMVTILFTDMEGSTSLTQRLGDAAAQALLRAHNALIRQALNAHGGSEIKHTGDGIMASFATASKALDCAVAIQRAFAARNEEHPDEALRVRVGLNAGEPVAEDQDLFGTAVQLAARVCAQAEAGQILVSNVVRELAAGKGFLFSDTGDATLRGFEDPVRLYDVSWKETR